MLFFTVYALALTNSSRFTTGKKLLMVVGRKIFRTPIMVMVSIRFPRLYPCLVVCVSPPRLLVCVSVRACVQLVGIMEELLEVTAAAPEAPLDVESLSAKLNFMTNVQNNYVDDA